MANKKISELASRVPSLSDLMLVGDPSSGYSYKCTITALATIIETDIADGYVTLGTTQTISGAKTFSNVLTLTSVANSAVDTDKFLVLTASNSVNYRTGAEVLSDIGGASAALYVPYTGATTNVNLGDRYLKASGLEIATTTTASGSLHFKQGISTYIQYSTGYTAISVRNQNLMLFAFNQGVSFDYKNFQIDVANITTGTTRTYTMPNASGTLALTSDITSAISGTTNYIPKFTGTSAIGNSIFTESGGNTLRIIAANAAVRLSGSNEYILQTVDADGRFRIYDQTAALERVTLTSSGNLGIGTSAPEELLEILSATSANIRLRRNGTLAAGDILGKIDFFNADASGDGPQVAASVRAFAQQANGSGGYLTFNTATGTTGVEGADAVERMRLDASGNLGLGTSSPATKLQVYKDGTSIARFGATSYININQDGFDSYASGSSSTMYLNYYSGGAVNFLNGKMLLNSSGNLGLGVSPSAWASGGNLVVGSITTAIPTFDNGANWYFNAGFKYVTTGASTRYYQDAGTHKWFIAPSGTAGAAITFTQAMTLDASGRLGIGTTSPSRLLTISAINPQMLLKSTTTTGFSELYFGDSAADLGTLGYAHNGDYMYFNVNSSERMRITSAGDVGIGTTSPTSRLTVKGESANTITVSGTTVERVSNLIPSNDVGNLVFGFNTTTADSYIQSIFSGGALIFGTRVAPDNFERMRITSAGNVGIGTTSLTNINLSVSKSITGGATSYGTLTDGVIQSDVTTGVYYATGAATQATAFTLTNMFHYVASQGTIGANSAVTNQVGYRVQNNMTGATNNYGFYGDIASGSGRWNLYMNGTANNYLAGNLGIGTTSLTGINLRISKNITGSTTSYGVLQNGTVQSDVTGTAWSFYSGSNTAAASFTLSNYRHFLAEQGTFGASSSVTNQFAYSVSSNMTGATNNYAFHSNLAAASGVWNLYMAGTAVNYLAGNTGIGITSPASALHIDRGNATASYLQFTAGTTTGQASTDGFDVGIDASGNAVLNQQENLAMLFSTNNGERMRITSGGNVGIGTTSPAVKFEVAGSGSIGYFRNPSSTTATTYISVINANNTSNGLVMAHISDGTGYFGTQNNAALRFVTNDAEKMRITSGGELLINTTSDAGDYKLQVNGNVYAGGRMDIYDNTNAGTLRLSSDAGNARGYLLFGRLNSGSFQNVGTISVDSDASSPNNGIMTFFTSNSSGVATQALKLTSTQNAEFSGSIKTAAPSGGTAKPFKIGAAAVVSPTSPNRTIEIEIDGVTYYLSAKTTND